LLGGLQDVGKVGMEGLRHLTVLLDTAVLVAEAQKSGGALVVKFDETRVLT
jgi:hypothetical protein